MIFAPGTLLPLPGEEGEEAEGSNKYLSPEEKTQNLENFAKAMKEAED